MSIFKKIGKGLKNAGKFVGKGIGNAAKYTAKHPLKVLLPATGVAAVGLGLATAGAGMATKMATGKVGKTLFGKMLNGVKNTGTVVKNEIGNTLKSLNIFSKKNVNDIAKGLQEAAKQETGLLFPIDSKSATAEDSRNLLQKISDSLVSKILPDTRNTIDAERSILANFPETNGIISSSDISPELKEQLKNAGSLKTNLLGMGNSLLDSLGLGQNAEAKAQDVIGLLTGQNTDPYTAEDYNQGVNYVQTKLNESPNSNSITSFLMKPIVWIIGALAVAAYFIFKPKKRKKRR